MKRDEDAAAGEAVPELIDCLGGQVVRSIAGLTDATALWGQDLPSRRAMGLLPPAKFYGEKPMKGGLLGHSHHRIELATAIAGRFFFGIRDRIYRGRVGDWYLCGPDVLHGECRADGRTAYELLWFITGDNGLLLHKTCYDHVPGYRVRCRVMLGAAPADILNNLREICVVPWPKLSSSRLRLLRLVTWCLQRLEELAEKPAAGIHPLVRATQEALMQSLQNPPSVQELARRVGMSPNYLSTLFHHHCGMTIRRFVESRRIELACGHLRQSRQSIKDIAYTLNFADPYHFSHAFHRAMGMSPSQYRGKVAEIQTRDR